MELSYEKLDYQEQAVKSVVNTVSGHDDITSTILLNPEALDESVRETLAENGQKYPGTDYLNPFPQFNIEMETGTGKTMVYLQTIMVLHKKFRENKFIIVVPSRAIKAGVEDNLAKLKDYLSDTVNTDKYHYFVYDSKQIGELQNFYGSNFEIMVTTVQAFNSKNNVINQEYSEGFFGGSPIEQIQSAHPIVIIDEPQSVDGADAGKNAIKSLHPKLVLRYSATHKDTQYPLLYKFGPADAYNKRMVKQIETLGTEIDTDGNLPTVELVETPIFKNGQLQAKLKAYAAIGDDFDKKVFTVHSGDSLLKKTKNSVYEQLGKIDEINVTDQFVSFENGFRAELGSLDNEREIWVTSQMQALITDHLNRELKLQEQGIKVLSLIFLDEVKNYRIYTDKGPVNGQYADLFERLYEKILHSDSKYQKLNDYQVPVSEVHDGYFSMDKGTSKRPATYRDTKGDTIKDETAYEAIMADKEGLLTQYVPGKLQTNTKAAKLRFIFSHSALKEGWDNPNVFQILTITEPKKDLTRRQKIGRGLRIPVNQDGQRVYNNSQNIVTIYANESFAEFANGLQNEYLAAGIFNAKIDSDYFEGMIVSDSNKQHQLGTSSMNDNVSRSTEDNDESDSSHAITVEESSFMGSILRNMKILNSKNIPNPELFTRNSKIPIKHMIQVLDGDFTFSPFKCRKRASALV